MQTLKKVVNLVYLKVFEPNRASRQRLAKLSHSVSNFPSSSQEGKTCRIKAIISQSPTTTAQGNTSLMVAIGTADVYSKCWWPMALIFFFAIAKLFLRFIGTRSLELGIVDLITSIIVVLLLSLFISFISIVFVSLLNGVVVVVVVVVSTIALIVAISTSLTSSIVVWGIVVVCALNSTVMSFRICGSFRWRNEDFFCLPSSTDHLFMANIVLKSLAAWCLHVFYSCFLDSKAIVIVDHSTSWL